MSFSKVLQSYIYFFYFYFVITFYQYLLGIVVLLILGFNLLNVDISVEILFYNNNFLDFLTAIDFKGYLAGSPSGEG